MLFSSSNLFPSRWSSCNTLFSLGLSNAFCCESSENQSITIVELLLYQLGTGGEQNWKICRLSFQKPLGISNSQGIHSHGKSAGIWQVASDGSHGLPAICRLHKMLDLIWKKSLLISFSKKSLLYMLGSPLIVSSPGDDMQCRQAARTMTCSRTVTYCKRLQQTVTQAQLRGIIRVAACKSYASCLFVFWHIQNLLS